MVGYLRLSEKDTEEIDIKEAAARKRVEAMKIANPPIPLLIKELQVATKKQSEADEGDGVGKT